MGILYEVEALLRLELRSVLDDSTQVKDDLIFVILEHYVIVALNAPSGFSYANLLPIN